MAYDPTTQSVVMFGGDTGGAALGDTWSWDGSGWRELHPTVSPPPLTGALMAYDPHTRSLVLTGGYTQAFGGSPMESGTWTWDGGTWAPQPHGGLPAPGSTPWAIRLATDRATGQLILVTGLGSSSCDGFATWQWKSGFWARLDPHSSMGADGHGLLGFDSQQRSLLLYSDGDCHVQAGISTSTAFVWSWDGSAWSGVGRLTAPGEVQVPKMLITSAVTQAPGGGLLVPYAGATTILGPSRLSQVAAMPGDLGALANPNHGLRTGESVAYDAARNEVVLFGGEYLFGNGSDYLGDTWTWDGGWHLASTGTVVAPTPTPTPAPTPRPSPCASPTPQAGNGDQLQNLRMSSTSSGWAQRSSDGAILHTADGAERWTVVSPPLTGDQRMIAAAFLGASTAEALTGTLYSCYPAPAPERADLTAWSTSDGGMTWTQEGTFHVPDFEDEVPAPSGTLDFVNEKDGWFTVGQGSAMGSSGMALYRTVDGGAHWTEVAGTNPNGVGSIPFSDLKSNASFINPTTGWIAGTTYGSGAVFYVTHDGGATWGTQPLPGSSAFFQSSTEPPVFWAEQGGWVLATQTFGSQPSALDVTTDGGTTWNQITVPGQGQSASAADFIDQEDGWVLTAPPAPPAPASPAPATTPPVPSTTLWATTDGGRTWSPVWSRTGEVQIASLDFVTTEVGWAETMDGGTGASGLVHTADGGRTWTAMEPAISG